MMKRKADDSIEEAEANLPRKRAAIEPTEKHEHFRNGLFDRSVLDAFTKNYFESKPYKHGVIKDLVSPNLLRNVRSEIQENLSFTPKETDIYKIHQSGDLANLDGLDDSSLKLLPSLLTLRDALYSSTFREYLAKITGSGPLSGRKTDMAINVYTPGCHLLCHDDVIGSRRVSYILYLTDPDEPWKEEWGGALRLYPTESQTRADGQVVKIPLADHTVSIPPAFNQLSFFAVQPGESFHDVEEVYASQRDDNETKEDIKDRSRIETKEGFKDRCREETKDKTNDETKDETNDETNDETKDQNTDETRDETKDETKVQANDKTKDKTKDETKDRAKDGTGDNANANAKPKDQTRVRIAISGWYHIPQEREDGFVEGLEEELAEKSSLAQLQGNGDEFDMPLIKADTFSVNFNSSFSTDDSSKPPATSSREDPFLTEEDLNFLVKYINPTYLTPDTLESVSNLFTEQCSLTLETFLSSKFSESLRGYLELQESQRLPVSASEIETTTPWTVARPPHKHRFLFQQIRETRVRDLRSQSPLQDLLENLFPSRSFRKWLEIATGETVSSQNLLARRFRRGKDYTLATGYNEEDSRLEIIMAITPTTGWEPQEADEKTKDNQGRPSDLDVGGYVAYIVGDEEGDDGRKSINEAKVPSTTDTNTEPSEPLGSKSSKRPKADPAVYQAAGNDDDDGVLFSMPAGWNQLGIVLRDKGVMRFVKYVSQQAKGDRWDITGEFSVVVQEDEENVELYPDAATDPPGVIEDTTEMEEVEEESSDDWD